MEEWPKPIIGMPNLIELMETIESNGTCEATDGCTVEPDGICEHGHPSWVMRLGLV